MPVKWYNPSKCENDIELSICADKLPYFMLYTREQYKRRHNHYVTTREATCERLFGRTLAAIANPAHRSAEEAEYYLDYQQRFPFSLGCGVMNRICAFVESQMDNMNWEQSNVPEFDYRKLKRGIDYSNSSARRVREIYKQYTKDYQNLVKNMELSKSDLSLVIAAIDEHYKSELLAVTSNEFELCEILIDVAYTSGTSKQMVWNLVGDVIVKNLLERNGAATIPIASEDGDIEYRGKRFKMTRVVPEGGDGYDWYHDERDGDY